jgi:hypothetical protein
MNRTYPKTNSVEQSITRSRRLLLAAIKLTSGHDLSKQATRYFYHVDLWVKAEGKRSATVRCKRIYHIALNSLLKQPNPEYPFIKTKGGFPTICLDLRPLGSTPEGIQAILSLLGWYRGMVAPGEPDFGSITDPGVPVNPVLIKQIVSSTPPSLKVKLSQCASVEHLFRSKQGPNGQSTVCSILDLLSLEEHQLDAIRSLVGSLGSNEDVKDDFIDSLDELLSLCKTEAKVVHSRLAIKREGGGKDRVFAMVDYWTQCTLAPLHASLAMKLREIPQDCTYNQGKGVETLKSWTKTGETLYSYDLSSATDRFPLSLQRELLAKLVGDPAFADKWADLMTNRAFIYKGKPYRWSVGQPLGAYSSWPMFALSHHIVVLFAAKITKSPADYYLLGDDIVIKGDKLAQAYTKIMTHLGVSINLTKSLTGNSCEFAKRIFTQGRETSPVPVKLIQSLLQDPPLIREVVNHLIRRSPDSRITAHRVDSFLSEYLMISQANARTAEILVSAPFGELAAEIQQGLNPAGGSIWPVDEIGQRKLNKIVTVTKYEYLVDQYSKLMQTTSEKESELDKIEIPGLPSDYKSLSPANVGLKLLKEAQTRAHRKIGKYWTAIRGQDLDLQSVPLPDVHPISFECLTASHRSRVKHQSTLILKIFSAALLAVDNKEESPEASQTDQPLGS